MAIHFIVNHKYVGTRCPLYSHPPCNRYGRPASRMSFTLVSVWIWSDLNWLAPFSKHCLVQMSGPQGHSAGREGDLFGCGSRAGFGHDSLSRNSVFSVRIARGVLAIVLIVAGRIRLYNTKSSIDYVEEIHRKLVAYDKRYKE